MPIVLKGIYKSFRNHSKSLDVLQNLSITFPEGKSVAILGPSGCGKTTLLRLLAGLEAPDSGEVVISTANNSKLMLGMVFQNAALLPWRTALENVLLPLEFSHNHHSTDDRRRIHSKAIDLLARVGLQRFSDYYPHQLSGGMRARVAVARGLVTQPSILLLDEPFSALDEVTRSSLQDLLLQIVSELHLTVIFVTHSVDEAVVIADRVLVFSSPPMKIVADVPVGLSRNACERRDSLEVLELRASLRSVLSANVKSFEAQK